MPRAPGGPVARLAEIGDSGSFPEAAAPAMAGLAALRVVRLAGPMLPILGARGGVGHLTRGSPPAAAADRSGPAPHHPLVGEEPERAASDVVIDGIRGASLEPATHAVAPGGATIRFGATGRGSPMLTLLDVISHEGARTLTHFVGLGRSGEHRPRPRALPGAVAVRRPPPRFAA